MLSFWLMLAALSTQGHQPKAALYLSYTSDAGGGDGRKEELGGLGGVLASAS